MRKILATWIVILMSFCAVTKVHAGSELPGPVEIGGKVKYVDTVAEVVSSLASASIKTVILMQSGALTAPLTVTSGKTYAALPGAILTTSAANTLTFATGSQLEDNGGQMFTSSVGEVIFASNSIPVMYSYWFATGDVEAQAIYNLGNVPIWVKSDGTFVATSMSHDHVGGDGALIPDGALSSGATVVSAGAADSGKLIKLDAEGKADESVVKDSDIDHGNLGGLADDDHSQYHNDTRGDARYFQKTEHLNTSAGAADAGKPIKLDADGNIDATMINDGDVDHGNLGGLADDDHTQYFKESEIETSIDATGSDTKVPSEQAVREQLFGKKLSADYGNDLATAITAIGATVTHLKIDAATTVSTTFEVPRNVTLDIANGGIITISAGTLTVSGAVNAGRYQIFSITGTGAITGLTEAFPEWMGAIPDDANDDEPAWTDTIASMARHGVISGRGVYRLGAGLLVDENPLVIIGHMTYGMVFAPKSGFPSNTAMMTVNSTVRGTVPAANWWTIDHDNGFTMRNVIFEGSGRDYLCHGLVFTGKNSDTQLSDVAFLNIKGSGMKACDPFGTTEDDAVTGNLMQQCQFHNIRMQNCGYEATGGTDAENYIASHAAYEIGRNYLLGSSGSHNHLKHTGVTQIGYSRWRGIRVLNRGGEGDTGPNMHELTFQDLFIHGNEGQSVTTADENGEYWRVREWQAGTAYIAGDIVYPTDYTGYSYECTTPGTSDGAEPSPWPTVVGNTIADGATLVWTCRALFYSGTPRHLMTVGNIVADGETSYVGNLISVTGITAGVCATANTEGLATGERVMFNAGGSTANTTYEVTSVTTNVSFTIDDTSITDATAVDCYEVSNAYNTGEIKSIFVDRFHLVEMEIENAGLIVGECWNGAGDDVGASVHLTSGQFGASAYTSPSYGVIFDGSESSYVGGITYHSAGGPANSVYIRSLLDGYQEITLGPMTAEVPPGTPAASATKYIKTDIGQNQIHDLTVQTYTALVPSCDKTSTGDTDGSTAVITGIGNTSQYPPGTRVMVSAGFATTGPYEVVDRALNSITLDTNSNAAQVNIYVTGTIREFTLARALPDYKFIKRAWLTPEWGGLTANDTDYANINVGYRTNAGAHGTGSPVTTTTKTAGSGGTGDWTAFVPVELSVDRGVAYLPVGGSVTFEITQSGAGAETPTLLVGFECSDWKYFQDP